MIYPSFTYIDNYPILRCPMFLFGNVRHINLCVYKENVGQPQFFTSMNYYPILRCPMFLSEHVTPTLGYDPCAARNIGHSLILVEFKFYSFL